MAALALSNAAASSDAQTYPASDAVPGSSKPLVITATPVPEQDMEATFEALRVRWARGKDLNNIAESLASSMQQVMDLRPDLADAQFDFVLDDGRIRVVDDQLSIRDRDWLEGQLNDSDELRTWVQQFHDHTVDAYALARKGSGVPLSDAEYEQANVAVDRQFKYMSLLKDVAGRIRHDYRAQPEFSYRDQDGAPMSFKPDPGSARGVVDFMNRIRSLTSAPLTLVLSRGRTDQVPMNDPFGLAGRIIDGYSPEESGRQ